MLSFLTELLRNLGAIRTAFVFVVVLVAIGAWIWAAYLRHKPQSKADEILGKLTTDKAKIAALKEIVGADRIPEKLERAEILEVLKLHYRIKTQVLILIAVLATLVAIVAIVVVLNQTKEQVEPDPGPGAPTGTSQTDTAATTKTSTTGTTTPLSSTVTGSGSAPPSPPPPASTPVAELIAAVHSAPSADETNWPARTLVTLDALGKRQNELTQELRDQLRARADAGEGAIRDMLKGTVGAPAEATTDHLWALVNVHQKIAALAGETGTWKDTAQMIWNKQPVNAEKWKVPGEEKQ